MTLKLNEMGLNSFDHFQKHAKYHSSNTEKHFDTYLIECSNGQAIERISWNGEVTLVNKVLT